MRAELAVLANEHRPLEAALDRLGQTVLAGHIDTELLDSVGEALSRHYAHEEEFLSALDPQEPALAAKLRAQHQEVLELSTQLHASLQSGNAYDVSYLSRRFLAMAQHNMIEEERDVFPLADSWS